MRAKNHPKHGDSIRTEPFRDPKDIRSIKRLLADQPRNLCLFTLGINTNLRASDLVRLTVGLVRGVLPGQEFQLKEKKTGKLKSVTVNKTVHETIQKLLATMPDTSDDTPLFRSRKGGKAICVAYVVYLVKSWAREINLKGNYGSHSLRKTFGYQHRVQFNTSVPILMELFNHSTQKQTMQYLGIQPSELKDAYLKEI
jgi:integrase